jgi:hypothetical protein
MFKNVLWRGTEFGTGTVLTQAVEWLLAVAKCCGNSSVTIFPTCGEAWSPKDSAV